MLEDLIHSMQQHVEVDEPEPDAVPMLPSGSVTVMMEPGDPRARLEDDVLVDRMTEEDLLRGIEGIGPAIRVDPDQATDRIHRELWRPCGAARLAVPRSPAVCFFIMRP